MNPYFRIQLYHGFLLEHKFGIDLTVWSDRSHFSSLKRAVSKFFNYRAFRKILWTLVAWTAGSIQQFHC